MSMKEKTMVSLYIYIIPQGISWYRVLCMGMPYTVACPKGAIYISNLVDMFVMYRHTVSGSMPK